MKAFLLSFLMAGCALPMMAQTPISAEANSLRGGDRLCKIQVEYVNPGDGGPDEVWTLGQVTRRSKDFLQTIASSGDTIAVFERGRIQHYLMRGDTLADKGEQSRRAFCLCDRLRPVVRFPFQYGDSLSGFYSGCGREENVDFVRSGWSCSVADGTGLLTDGIDTIPNVTRVHIYNDYTDTYFSSDTVSLRLRCEQFSWFCAGYRYPVMESFRWLAIEADSLCPAANSVATPYDSVTYLFPPVMQLDLADDAANDSIRESVLVAASSQGASAAHALRDSSVKAGLSADGLSLSTSYSLDSASDITLLACDILGNLLSSCHYDNRDAGEWQECISLSRRPIGNALMLCIQCGSQTINLKVYE